MKKVKAYVEQMRIMAQSMKDGESLYYIKPEGSAELFSQKAAEWHSKEIEIHDEIDSVLLSALQYILCMKGLGHCAHAIRNTVLSKVFGVGENFIFIADGKQNLILYAKGESEDTLFSILKKVNLIFEEHFNNTVSLEKANLSCVEEFGQRIEEAEQYYLVKHGAWTQAFIDNLGDELSVASFRNFLFQRIQAHILWHAIKHYPITPTYESLPWRNMRLQNPPPLPILDHCTETYKDFFNLQNFIFEQYGIENKVQVQEGDIVIDAGAYIGDTALYFAQRVGNTGKVYAFEITAESIEACLDNMRKNNYDNVEVVPYALSDKSGIISFSNNELAPSANREDSTGNLEAKTITLDAFRQERNITVDFIKADIEGAEMSLLRGAEHTIVEDRPMLGVVVYHKQDDFWEIPMFLQKLCPEYTFYFRCEVEPIVLAKVKK